MKRKIFTFLLLILVINISAQDINVIKQKLYSDADKNKQLTIDLRRDFHKFPELSNREFRTSKVIKEFLTKLGYETKTFAKTGVVAVLKGSKASPVVAFRADIDALPVPERNNLPFCSKARGFYNGDSVSVMHACGHDAHTAILMTLAKILMENKDKINGSVKFIFQPAEEGAPKGEEGGAELMIKEGVLDNPKVDVIFGLHISSKLEVNKIGYKTEGIMASVSDFKVILKGTQTHGAAPWEGSDPIVATSYIITALQSVVSRNVNITENPAVVTVGAIHAGVRSNIIPESLEMLGTIRTFSNEDKIKVPQRFREIVSNISSSLNVNSEVFLPYSVYYPVTYNNPELVSNMLPGLIDLASKENIELSPPITGSEDFSFFSEKVPGFYFFLGGLPKGNDKNLAASHHTPDFFIDDSGLDLGVKAFCSMLVDYLNINNKK